MKCCYLDKPIFKDVVIIGNGPSGIVLSLMLDGWTPFLTRTQHPDEFLSARLEGALAAAEASDTTSEYGLPLVQTELLELAQGLDGRTTNPVSLLYDALMRPYADMGMEMESLIKWRRTGQQIDHVVLGKGPPGGSWHSMDPHILTLSLASWMALPGLPFTTEDIEDSSSVAPLRASAQQVATYYESYVSHMNLEEYFRSNVIVTQIRPLENKCTMMKELNPLRAQCEYKWVQKIKSDWKTHQTICTQPESKAKPLCTNNNDNQQQCRRRCLAGYIRTLMPRRCNKQNHLEQEPLKDRPSDVSQTTENDTKELIHEIFDPNEDKISVDNKVEDRGRSREEEVDDVCLDCQKERAQARVTGSGEIRVNGFCRCLCNRENNYRRSTKKRKEENNDLIAGRMEGGNKKSDRPGYNNQTNNLKTALETNNNKNKPRPKWLIDIYDKSTRVTTTYTCNTLVLANGAHDLPNKLSLHQPSINHLDDQQTPAEPHWLLHDVRSLEIELDLCTETRQVQQGRRCGDVDSNVMGKGIDPVLVVGAGLSAADAILATRKRGIPVLHVFRSKSSDLIKKLPENMYPEYHKIHQMMMQQSTISTPNYTPFPAHTISAIDAETNTVTIVDQHTGLHTTHRVSFAAVLIGSRPDLGFLPPGYKLGKRRTLPVDSKTNTVNIDRGSHAVSGFEGLYALGPLAGDNFVRFLPGGCLAAVGDMYRKRGVTRLE